MTNLDKGMDQNKVKASSLSTKIKTIYIYFYSQSYSPSVLPFLSSFT